MNRTLPLVVMATLVALNLYLASFTLGRASTAPLHNVSIPTSLQQQVQTLQQQVSALQKAQTSLSAAFYTHYHTVTGAWITMKYNNSSAYKVNVVYVGGAGYPSWAMGSGSYTLETSLPIR